MDENIKILVQKTIDHVCRKIRNAAKKEFYKFENNIGIGADGTTTKYVDKIAEEAALNILNRSKLKINEPHSNTS